MSEKFKQLIEERKRQIALQAAQEEAEKAQYADLVPQKEYERTESDKQIDDFIARLDIIDAYNKWCGKSKPQPHGNQREGILVSCPNPWHEDKHPSCWLNLDKKVWVCAKCNMGFRPDTKGGDIYDLAAIKYNMPDYQEGANFRELRELMAKDFGYVFVNAPGFDAPMVLPPHAEDQEQPKAKLRVVGDDDPPEPSLEEDNVVSIDGEDDDEEEFKALPDFDWQSTIESGTFLDKYMQQTQYDDIPDEYNFWNGLMALGLAVGRDVTLYDRTSILANIFVCIVGRTGDGKSRSFRHLYELLEKAVPYDASEDIPTGVQIIKTPNSAEVLVHSFDKRAPDVSGVPGLGPPVSIRGLVEYNEMSALIGRTQRSGTSTIKPTVMEFFDSPPTISFRSMKYATPITAHRPFAGMFTTAQPAVFKDLFDDSDLNSGFMNRWIFATGKQKESVAIGGARIDVEPAIEPLQLIHRWGERGRELEWNDEAHREFTLFFHDTLEPARRSDPLLMRIDLTMKKLILLFAINEMSDVVEKSHVEKAMALFDYLVLIYELLGIEVRKNPYSEMRRTILDKLERGTKKNPERGVTMRELKNLIRRRDWDPNQVLRVIEAYRKLGLIRVELPSGVGRHTPHYFYEA